MFWTYKTLALTEGRPEWMTAEFSFVTIHEASNAASAYMAAHAAKGEMVVVSLEPAPELKAASERLREHAIMLRALKNTYTSTRDGWLRDLIREIDPSWTADGA